MKLIEAKDLIVDNFYVHYYRNEGDTFLSFGKCVSEDMFDDVLPWYRIVEEGDQRIVMVSDKQLACSNHSDLIFEMSEEDFLKHVVTEAL
jgi:hypothetical protein